MKMGALSYAQLLQGFADRADSEGYLSCSWSRPQGLMRSLRMLPRLHSGLQSPVTFRSGVDGHSPFDAPRLVRNCLRLGFGERMVDLDMVNAHYHIAAWVGRTVGVPLHSVEEYVTHREEWLGAVVVDLRISREEAKTMLIAVGYGAAPVGHDLVVGLSNDMRDLAEELVRRFPWEYDRIRQAKAHRSKSNPKFTLLSYVLIHQEQIQMARVCKVAGRHIMSYEADGLVVLDCPPEVLEEMKRACRFPLVAKLFPQTAADLLKEAAERYKNVDWELKSKFPWREAPDRFVILSFLSFLRVFPGNQQ
jgi:hypothetical protein